MVTKAENKAHLKEQVDTLLQQNHNVTEDDMQKFYDIWREGKSIAFNQASQMFELTPELFGKREKTPIEQEDANRPPPIDPSKMNA